MILSTVPIYHDLLGAPRRKWFYWTRVAFVALGALVSLYGMGITRMMGGKVSQNVGLLLFSVLAWPTLIMLNVVSMGYGAHVVVREKEERTLGLLLMTHLTPRSFLSGKLLTALFHTSVVLFSLLPMFLVCASMGGISGSQIVMAFVLYFFTMLIGCCLGLFVGSLCARMRSTNTGNFLLLMLLFVAPPLVFIMVADVLMIPPVQGKTWLCWISPYMALSAVLMGEMPMDCLVCFLLMTLAALTFFVLAGLIMNFWIRCGPRPARRRDLISVGRSSRRPVRGNPIAWRDFQFCFGGRWRSWLHLASVGIVLAAVFALYMAFLPSEDTFTLQQACYAWLGLMFLLCAFVPGIGFVHHCGSAFEKDRSDNAMEALLITDLSVREILLGKLLACFKAMGPWLVVGAAMCAAMCAAQILNGDFILNDVTEGEFLTLVLMLLDLLSTHCFCSLLALWTAITSKHNIGVVAAMGLLVLWHFIFKGALNLYACNHFENLFLDIVVFGVGVILLWNLLEARFRWRYLNRVAGALRS